MGQRSSDTYREITDRDDPLLDSFWLPLYRRAFPDNERVDEENHRKAAVSTAGHVLVGFAGDQPISMARYDVKDSADPYAYLMYMAVDERAVSKGHGQQAFAEIVRRVTQDPSRPHVLIMEVQCPDASDSIEPHQSPKRRISFYLRLGCSLLDGVEYTQHVPGQPGVPMMIVARAISDQVSPIDVYAAAHDLFGDDIRQTGDLRLSREL